MRQRCIFTRLFSAGAVLMMVIGIVTAAQAATSQSITLHPGWNSVYLEVQPDILTPATVFKDLPVESVWTWYDRGSTIEFIRDPTEGLWAQPGWSVYTAAPEKAAAVNLFAIFANRAYLIKLGGTQSVIWTVTGVPATAVTTWTANSYNLVGFHVNPATPPTFGGYFAASPELKGQPVYRLSSLGKWELVTNPATTPIRSGEACWVYCNGASVYQGPLSVQYLGSQLDFGTSLPQKEVTLVNNAPSGNLTATITFQPAADWFVYRLFNTATGYYEYPRLDSRTVQLPAGVRTAVGLAVRRELLTTGLYGGILVITDDAGSRFMIPVSAQKL